MGGKMSLVGLHDADKTRFPNLALMKISAWIKQKGEKVEWFNSECKNYDFVVSSKVFTYTKDDISLPEETEKGGYGYGLLENLPSEVEHICPDYSLYNLNYSLGFLTRGCNKKCGYCIVPKKEGKIKAHADIEEFTKHKNVVLMDNNVLQHEHGLNQIEKIAKLNLKVDFNQGFDCDLIDDSVAKLLSKLKWSMPVRLACDHIRNIEKVEKAIQLLRWHNVTPRAYFCYVLVKEIDSALERIRFLKGMNIDCFAQPFRDEQGTLPTKEQRQFARWVNHKAIFKSVTWNEYKESRKDRV